MSDSPIDREDAVELARRLRDGASETRALGEVAFASAMEGAAGTIEQSIEAGDLEAVPSAVSAAWRQLGEFALTRRILAGSPRAFTAAQAGSDPSGEGATLERTPEAVFFLQRMVRDIGRSV